MKGGYYIKGYSYQVHVLSIASKLTFEFCRRITPNSFGSSSFTTTQNAAAVIIFGSNFHNLIQGWGWGNTLRCLDRD